MPKVETTSISPQVSQAARVCTTQTIPRRAVQHPVLLVALAAVELGRAHQQQAAMTARKLAALTAKQMVTPRVAIRIPATAGPPPVQG